MSSISATTEPPARHSDKGRSSPAGTVRLVPPAILKDAAHLLASFPLEIFSLSHLLLHRRPLFLTLVASLAIAFGSSVSSPHGQAAAAQTAGAYAALGASETYGIGATPRTRGYAFRVARTLHASRFVDAGIPGAPLGVAYHAELTKALSVRPSLCTVFFGFNDLRTFVPETTYLRQLRSLVTALRRAHCRVLVIGLPNLALLPAVAAFHLPGLKQVVTAWNAGTRTVAQQTGASYLDLQAYNREIATHPSYVSADGLHPNNTGHARLAQVVGSAIQRFHLWRP